MESRPTYIATRSDHYTTSHDLPPQVRVCRRIRSPRRMQPNVIAR